MLVYDSTLRVPLVIGAPASMGYGGATIAEPVSLAEIAPTILRWTGVTPPPEMRGRDLTRTFGTAYDMYSETEYPRVAGWSPLQALTDGRWMTIRAGVATEVYDLRADPREERDVFTSQAAVAAAMSARAGAIHASAAATDVRTISREAQERLRSLGYVASSTPAAPAADAPNPAARIAIWNEFQDTLSALATHRPDAFTRLQRLASANPDAPCPDDYARALKEAGQINWSWRYRAAAKRRPTPTCCTISPCRSRSGLGPGPQAGAARRGGRRPGADARAEQRRRAQRPRIACDRRRQSRRRGQGV
jgi:hypothetical protein